MKNMSLDSVTKKNEILEKGLAIEEDNGKIVL